VNEKLVAFPISYLEHSVDVQPGPELVETRNKRAINVIRIRARIREEGSLGKEMAYFVLLIELLC
jgi:hypothetical protein